MSSLLPSAARLVSAFCVVILAACDGKPGPSASAPANAPARPPEALTLTFSYGSEKKAWIEDVTQTFNAARISSSSGKPILIDAIPMGSGDCIAEVLSGKRQAHLISPASAVFLKLGNADSQAANGQALVTDPVNLVLSPVVIAMWQPMAEKLGWPDKSPGWADIHAMAADAGGWASRGAPQWGRFRFGHTHPDYSNSGLLSVLAEVSAATGKVRGLTLADVANPSTAAYLKQIESAVVHYGESTGFFADKMFNGGPEYLSAAVLYENMVVEARTRTGSKATVSPIVAIYPREGTYWSDHPAAVVNRPWVSPEQAAAAKKYIAFLTEPAQQQKALEFGFRPGDPAIPLASPIDAAHGVDPGKPQTLLEVPDTSVIAAIRQLWSANKKTSSITLVFDTSGSMNDEQKIVYAREGANAFISLLGATDELSILPFNDNLSFIADRFKVGPQRANLQKMVSGFFPSGGTHLYDAIADAVTRLKGSARPDQISAIIVLSDGADEGSTLSLPALLSQVKSDGENQGIRVFTIAYGAGAKFEVLEKIALTTRARAYRGDPKNIERVFREISTFF